jgi:hypothetical protein
MPTNPTLNRFSLFGLFASRAARHLGYAEDDARLLVRLADGTQEGGER